MSDQVVGRGGKGTLKALTALFKVCFRAADAIVGQTYAISQIADSCMLSLSPGISQLGLKALEFRFHPCDFPPWGCTIDEPWIERGSLVRQAQTVVHGALGCVAALHDAVHSQPVGALKAPYAANIVRSA